MLQVKNLVKRYTTKGETVTALDGVSVDFPEKGMVFLLGKSGSGKSTLLNVAGGLDTPDEGEVIVKGKSSKDFSASDFDSYRNTYVGFIFQEYNILNELTVAENVALAIELQGKPKDDALVARLLEEVELKGYGDRRPNTLSGGQKQRVAIARALVKDPEIIMADEPTGALDSATGAQVFDTLKKLSKEKLVVVVSHDRDFAERYADRIIELMDGKIISDMTRGEGEAENLTESGETLTVACGAALTDEDAQKVVFFLRRHKGGLVISAGEEVPAAKGAAFCATPASEAEREEDKTNFIRSRFPLRYALKMGASGLRFKPVRLAFTTLLATVAFIVFGVFSTLITYSEQKICASTLEQSDFQAAVLLKKGYCHSNATAEERSFPFNQTQSLHFDENDVSILEKEHPEMNFIPVIDFDLSPLSTMNSMTSLSDPSYRANYYYAQIRFFNGFIRASDVQSKTPFTLTEGRWPQPNDTFSEIVISEQTLETFKFYGYRVNADAQPVPIDSFSDLEGQLITAVTGSTTIYLRVVGVVDTGEDFSAYEFLQSKEGSETQREALRDAFRYSFASLGVVADTFYEENKDCDISKSYYENALASLKGRISWSTSYREDTDGVLYAYLYSTLRENRSGRCRTLMSYQREVDAARDVYYFTPYSFTFDITYGNRVLSEIIAIVGPVAVILAVFAALLLFNFISASINAKKKDIGILRAVGARGTDVFKIFLVESLAITLVSFSLGCLGAFAACAIANPIFIEKEILTYSFFLFDWVNALIVLGVALVTAFVATTIPVALNVRKKPVEAIRAI